MISRGEYWLLETLVDGHCCSLYGLGLANGEIERSFGRIGHSLNTADLIDAVLHLLREGDLIADGGEPDPIRFAPTRDELEEGLTKDLGFWYRISQQGAARWEAISKPDWNRLSLQSFYPDGHGEVIAVERDWAERCYSGFNHTPTRPVVGTDVWDEIEFWEATTWKTLPRAHRVQFKYVEIENWSRSSTRPAWLEKMGKWYTSPFESDEEHKENSNVLDPSL